MADEFDYLDSLEPPAKVELPEEIENQPVDAPGCSHVPPPVRHAEPLSDSERPESRSTNNDALARLLAAFPRDPTKHDPSRYNLPRKLIALDEPLRTLAAKAWLGTDRGRDWDRGVTKSDPTAGRYP